MTRPAQLRPVLVIVHPDDSVAFSWSHADAIDRFANGPVVLMLGGRGAGAKVQQILRAPLARLVERGLCIVKISNGVFGNQRGMPLPVEAAITVMKLAGLHPDRDRLVLTGSRGGDQPGSVHNLADAFAVLRFPVRIEPAVAED